MRRAPGLRHLVAMSTLELRQVSKVYGQGAAVVVVTHDAQLASCADRVVLIRDGRVVDQTVPAPGPETLLGQDR